MISCSLINFENECFCDQLYLPPRDLNLMSMYEVSLSNIVSISESCEDESALCINHSFSPPLLLQPQITVIQAHEQNIISPFDIVVLQSHSDAAQLITLCTLKYTNACVRSFVNELLFNYNFTWTLLISGANRVSSSAYNYSDYNCSACLWNMLVSQQGHLTQLRFENAHEPLKSFCLRLLTEQEALMDNSQSLQKIKDNYKKFMKFSWWAAMLRCTRNSRVFLIQRGQNGAKHEHVSF